VSLSELLRREQFFFALDQHLQPLTSTFKFVILLKTNLKLTLPESFRNMNMDNTVNNIITRLQVLNMRDRKELHVGCIKTSIGLTASVKGMGNCIPMLPVKHLVYYA